jgi:hypothetical protein
MPCLLNLLLIFNNIRLNVIVNTKSFCTVVKIYKKYFHVCDFIDTKVYKKSM